MRLIGLFLLLTAMLFAHKLNLFYSIDNNGSLNINSYFASGSPCRICKINLKNAEGNIIFTAYTDHNGDALIPNMPKTLTEITIDGGMGHAASATFAQTGNLQTEKEKPYLHFFLAAIGFIAAFTVLYFLKRKR